jgi:DNA repair photolyase
MRKVISASRRTDLVAFFPEWLASVMEQEQARVYGPSGYTYSVDLSLRSVHTIVLWSKNFANLIENSFGLRTALEKYEQLYLHFTITGLGGTLIEKGAPSPEAALAQLDELITIVGNPERISIRFDPVIYWKDGREVKTNLRYFETIAPILKTKEIVDVRFSFAQWYRKAKRRAERHSFSYIDPDPEQKCKDAQYLLEVAMRHNLCLYACSQAFLTKETGILSSACIDGAHLRLLHPNQEPVSTKKDKSQRTECGCTESIDIGSYAQFCPHSCLYCYANPKV